MKGICLFFLAYFFKWPFLYVGRISHFKVSTCLAHNFLRIFFSRISYLTSPYNFTEVIISTCNFINCEFSPLKLFLLKKIIS